MAATIVATALRRLPPKRTLEVGWGGGVVGRWGGGVVGWWGEYVFGGLKVRSGATLLLNPPATEGLHTIFNPLHAPPLVPLSPVAQDRPFIPQQRLV